MKNGVFLVIDRSNCRCGLTDRLKTAVGLYPRYAAILGGKPFIRI